MKEAEEKAKLDADKAKEADVAKKAQEEADKKAREEQEAARQTQLVPRNKNNLLRLENGSSNVEELPESPERPPRPPRPILPPILPTEKPPALVISPKSNLYVKSVIKKRGFYDLINTVFQ